MAEASPPPNPPATDADKARARQWFKKANDCRERREYDYAIECMITGLGFWIDAVEEGLMPLASIAVQRQQAGGKKPSLIESMRKPTGGKDVKQAFLNSLLLMAKDPLSGAYLDAAIKNAARGGFYEAMKWIAPKVMESLRRDNKPDMGRFKSFREALIEAADGADAAGLGQYAPLFLDQAVASLEFLIARNPANTALRDEQRNLAGKLTISKGKYGEADTFRESVRDADRQKYLHDAERVQQTDRTGEDVIAAAKREWEAEPDSTPKFNAWIDVLLKREREADENEAIRLLSEGFERTQNYNLKSRADDVRLRQLKRSERAISEQARASGSDDDRQQARLAAREYAQAEKDVYLERVEKYPTELRLKFRLGAIHFALSEFDEAIPMLQAGQGDPRSRIKAMLLMGRAFYEKGNFDEAVEVLREAIGLHELPGDDVGKEMLYWLGRSLESAGNTTEAKATYGKLLRVDYNYKNGDARKRQDALK